MVSDKVRADALAAWDAGEPAKAGQFIYLALPNDERPLWAADMLSVSIDLIPELPPIQHVLTLAVDARRWREGHKAFGAVRDVTINVSWKTPDQHLLLAVLNLAELTAKVIYNASGEPAPFDADAGWWVPASLSNIAALTGDADLANKARELLVAY